MLDILFNPKSVAIIGASTKELSIGNVITKNLLQYKYKGAIYPINPNADEVRGLKAFKTIFDVPGVVDLAHIVSQANSYLKPLKIAEKRKLSLLLLTVPVSRKWVLKVKH